MEDFSSFLSKSSLWVCICVCVFVVWVCICVCVCGVSVYLCVWCMWVCICVCMCVYLCVSMCYTCVWVREKLCVVYVSVYIRVCGVYVSESVSACAWESERVCVWDRLHVCFLTLCLDEERRSRNRRRREKREGQRQEWGRKERGKRKARGRREKRKRKGRPGEEPQKDPGEGLSVWQSGTPTLPFRSGLAACTVWGYLLSLSAFLLLWQNTMTKSNLGGGVYSLMVPQNGSLSKAVRAGTHAGQEPGGRSWCRGHGGCCLLVCSAELAQPAFFLLPFFLSSFKELFIYFMYMSTLSLSSDTRRGHQSHYRWLWTTMWLLGLNSGLWKRSQCF